MFPQDNSNHNNPLNSYFVDVYIYSTSSFKKDKMYLKMYKQVNIQKIVIQRKLKAGK